MSKSVDLAEAVAAHLNSLPWEWPHPDPDGVTNAAPHLITEYATAKTVVLPNVSRTVSDELRILVSPPMDTRQLYTNDRCGRRWNYGVNIAVTQRVDASDTDFEQPMTLRHLRALMSLNEAILDFLDANRTVTSPLFTGSLKEIDQIAYDDNVLRNEHIYLGNTQPIYLQSN